MSVIACSAYVDKEITTWLELVLLSGYSSGICYKACVRHLNAADAARQVLRDSFVRALVNMVWEMLADIAPSRCKTGSL